MCLEIPLITHRTGISNSSCDVSTVRRLFWDSHHAARFFDTPEQWRSWLHRMADQITYCQDEDNGNEYAKLYLDELMKNPSHSLFEDKTPEEKELFEKYYKRSLEVMDEHKKLFEDTMREMIEHWDCLWD